MMFKLALLIATVLIAASSLSSARADDLSVEVLHYFTSGGEAAAIKELRKAFEAQGGTWVDSPVAGGSGDAHDQVLRSRTLAGNAPAAAMPKIRDAAVWGQQGYIVDLSDVAKAEKWDEVYPSVVSDIAKQDGKWVAVPIDLQRGDFMWVNPKVLQKVGVNEPPKTWDDFIAVCDKLKVANVPCLAHGGQSWQDGYLFVAAVIGVGGIELYNKAIAQGDIDAVKSPQIKQAFDELRKMRGYVDDNFSGRDWNLATAMLMKGDAAFQIMGDWVKGEVTHANLVPGKDILCISTPRAKDTGYLWSSNTMSFFTKTKGDDKATAGQKLLAKVISSGAAETAYSLNKGNTPARLGVDPAPFDTCAKFEMSEVAKSVKDGTLVPDLVPGMTATALKRGAMQDVITQFFNSQESSEEAQAALVDALSE
jgi:glucose/mannose transport system substrate-binding protein